VAVPPTASPRSRDKTITGGKGANLAEMAGIGLPVPPGFTISTEVCTAYNAAGKSFDDDLRAGVAGGVAHIEKATGRVFGDPANPLLVSVRSGARVSMPGMMDTVLNLGLNDVTVEGLAAVLGRSRASRGTATAASSRCIRTSCSASIITASRNALEIAKDRQWRHRSTPRWRAERLAGARRRIQGDRGRRTRPPVPAGRPRTALGRDRAPCSARWIEPAPRSIAACTTIPQDWGTAVNVQAMVFGNMGETAATGVAFTRDPSTGERVYYGECLVNAQGEDVVAGIRTPQPIDQGRARAGGRQAAFDGRGDARRLWRARPTCSTMLEAPLQGHAGHRVHRRAGQAVDAADPHRASARPRLHCKIAVDMAREGLIDEDDGGQARRSDGARSAAPPDTRSQAPPAMC
jgi:pyruvate,orthophosphate dikinase